MHTQQVTSTIFLGSFTVKQCQQRSIFFFTAWTEKSVSNMMYFALSGAQNLNSINVIKSYIAF